MFNTPSIKMVGFDYQNATELEEIEKNLLLLYSTIEGTLPGARSFGLNPSFESCPVNVAKNLFALEVIEKTEIYENRAEILDISYTQSGDGNITPKITIGIKEQDGDE